MHLWLIGLFSFFLVMSAHAQIASDDQDAVFEEAFSLLGFDSDVGEPDEEAVAKAFSLLAELDELENPYALNLLGVAHLNGWFSVEQNTDLAESYFRRVLPLNPEDIVSIAALNLADLLSKRASFGDELWDEILQLATLSYGNEELGGTSASLIAQALIMGPKSQETYSTAEPYLLEAVEFEADNSSAVWFLARGYFNGWYGETDKAKGCEYYLRAAELELDNAYWQLGMCYLAGTGVEFSEERAFEWVHKGALADHQDAMVSLAVMYATAEGVELNPEESAAWYLKMVEIGGGYQAHAMRGLGSMHVFNELSGAERPVYGMALLELADEGGDDQAPLLLSRLDPIEGEPRVAIDAEKVRLANLYGITN